jgi:hypothetical protein
MEALFQRVISDALKLDISDLWEQRELAMSYWLLLMTGVNQEEEIRIANALLLWKALLAKDGALVRCIQTSDRREFACCQSRFGPIDCPTLVISDSSNVESFVSVGPELLYELASSAGCLQRFLSRIHHSIETGASLRDVEAAIRGRTLWASLKLDFDTVKHSVASAVTPSWKRDRIPPRRAMRHRSAKLRWIPGDFSNLATLVDRNADELAPILQTVGQTLGCGIGDLLSRSDATHARKVPKAIYEAVCCTTNVHYDWEPATPGENDQEVRLAGKLLKDKVGTCLDLALLYAALLERAHSAPAVLVVDTGDVWHSIGAFFDRGAHDATPLVLTDAKAIRELVRRGALIPVETTGLSTNKGTKKTYEEACEEGTKLLTTARPLALVNILVARNRGFKPPE